VQLTKSDFFSPTCEMDDTPRTTGPEHVRALTRRHDTSQGCDRQGARGEQASWAHQDDGPLQVPDLAGVTCSQLGGYSKAAMTGSSTPTVLSRVFLSSIPPRDSKGPEVTTSGSVSKASSRQPPTAEQGPPKGQPYPTPSCNLTQSQGAQGEGPVTERVPTFRGRGEVAGTTESITLRATDSITGRLREEDLALAKSSVMEEAQWGAPQSRPGTSPYGSFGGMLNDRPTTAAAAVERPVAPRALPEQLSQMATHQVSGGPTHSGHQRHVRRTVTVIPPRGLCKSMPMAVHLPRSNAVFSIVHERTLDRLRARALAAA
jgi:hypothetical protein